MTLSAVFNDPVLYGLRVALDGKRVGKLAGLEFEILYRKISDSIGVFHTELKLPDAVRTIEAGEATITLPIIDIDVYTNGNFLVDLGFPRNLDFSRALSVDFIVFVPVPIPVSAAVGLYFGVLSGATSSQVPQITNGRFDPVIVAGVGVRVGIGYAISFGPLQADFFAGVVGIVEGVLAWFHPDADPTSTSVYYRVSGTVGILIHIAGTVNLAILQASVDIEAYADATAVLESYQPIHLTFEAGVSISLSVKVLFFHITLSFSATIRESITIGSASPTPWVLGAGATRHAGVRAAAAGPRHAAFGRRRDPRERALRRGAGHRHHVARPDPARVARDAGSADRRGAPAADGHRRAGRGPAGRSTDDHGAAAARRRPVRGRSRADGGRAGGGEPGRVHRPPERAGGRRDGRRPLRLRNPERADGGAPPGRRARHAHGDRDRGRRTAARLGDRHPRRVGRAVAVAVRTAGPRGPRVGGRVGGPLGARGGGRCSGRRGTARDGQPDHGQPPACALCRPGRPRAAVPLARVVDFLTTRNISLDLQPIPTTPQNPSFTVFPMPPFVAMAVEGETVDFSTGPYAAGPEYQSFVATYFQELAAATPGPAGGPAAARDAGPNTPAAESVAAVLFTDYFAFLLRQLLQDALDLYRAYPHSAAGETLDDVASRFGISAPGPVPDDAAVVRIGRANQASATFFAPGAELTVRRLSTRVVDGETLRSLAGRLHSTPLQVARAVRDRTGVLQVGSELTIVGGRCTVREGDTLARVAARLATTIDVVVGAAANVPRLLTPLTTLTLPTGAYVVAPGDTLGGIAALHGLTPSQVGQAAADAPDLLFAGVGFALPTLTYAVAGASATSTEAETLASIADRFGTTPAALVGGGNADAPALRPGAEVSFGVTTQVRSGETLRQLAERFGLAQQSGPADLVRALDDTPGLLVAGATLVVARPGTYVVKDGDTLASIADAFSTTAQAITSANPTVDCQPGHPCWYPSPDASLPRPGMNLSAPVGLTIALPPGLTYTVQPNDTLATIAARFTLSAAELVVGSADGDVNLDNAGLLVPLATVALPDIPYVVTPPDTPLRIAQRFGLTVDQLVLTNRDVGFGTVVVPDAEVLPLGVLVDELARAGAFNKPAGALARFLLHGLRLPSPDEITAATPPDRAALRLYPLYTLTGAQVTPPSPLPGDYAITLSSVTGAGHPTITFPGGSDHVTVPLSSDDREMLGKIAAQLAQQPPIDDTPLAATAYPATVVAPRQYALGKPIPWQAADPPRLVHDPGTSAAAPTVGAPTLYPFPDAVRSQVAATAGLWVDQVADAVKDVHGLLATGFRLVLGAGTHVVTADDTLSLGRAGIRPGCARACRRGRGPGRLDRSRRPARPPGRSRPPHPARRHTAQPGPGLRPGPADRPGDGRAGHADRPRGPAAAHRLRLGDPDRLRATPRPRPGTAGPVRPHRLRGVRNRPGRDRRPRAAAELPGRPRRPRRDHADGVVLRGRPTRRGPRTSLRSR